MQKAFLCILAFSQSMIFANQLDAPEHPRHEKLYIYFSNKSSYPVTIIAEHNQQITLQPYDNPWPFKILYGEVTIIAHIDYNTRIINTFYRESNDEIAWNIHVYKPIKTIRIERIYWDQ